MRLINIETLKLEEFFAKPVPPYAILSHTWGIDEDEVSFRDFKRGGFEKGGTQPTKLIGCCTQTKKDGLRYVWIDTCCIDKASSAELNEAINSMFQWYTNAAFCYVYLSDVPKNDNPRDPKSAFISSRWFTRGWTLQELLAPNNVHFYDSTWSFLGTRGKLSAVVETITGIPRPFLLRTDLRKASVAQRMSWAARRVTKRKEDIAYCLLGIFGVMMPLIYGEGDRAFRRLQEEIVKHSQNDDSILAWGLDLTESISNNSNATAGQALAVAPSDFAGCGRIVLRGEPFNSLELSGGRIRVSLPLRGTPTGTMYGLLNCGPEHQPEGVAGIPLASSLSNEYFRLQGHPSILLPKKASGDSKFISIQLAPDSTMHSIVDWKPWFYIEEPFGTDLELVDVHPWDSWQQNDSVIVTKSNDNNSPIQQTLARFRSKNTSSYDFILVLEFEASPPQAHARCHLMVSSRDTPLESLSQNLIHLSQRVFGRQSASNGLLNVAVTLQREFAAEQLMFEVKLAVISSVPEITVDATVELQLLDIELDLKHVLDRLAGIQLLEKQLRRNLKEKMTEMEPKKNRLAAVEKNLREIEKEKMLLVDDLEKDSQEVKQLTTRNDEIKKHQGKLLEQKSAILQRYSCCLTRVLPSR